MSLLLSLSTNFLSANLAYTAASDVIDPDESVIDEIPFIVASARSKKPAEAIRINKRCAPSRDFNDGDAQNELEDSDSDDELLALRHLGTTARRRVLSANMTSSIMNDALPSATEESKAAGGGINHESETLLLPRPLSARRLVAVDTIDSGESDAVHNSMSLTADTLLGVELNEDGEPVSNKY